MKKCIYTLFMPLFIFVSIVGTAFATWYFTENLTTETKIDLPVSVEKYVGVGTIDFLHEDGSELDPNYHYKLVIDQKHIELNEKIKVRYTIDPENIDTSIKPVFTYTIEFSTEVTHYLKINSPEVTDEQVETGRYEFTWNENFNFEKETYYTSNILFEYRPENLPSTDAEYNETYEALVNGNIKITFKANVNKPTI